MARSKRKQPSRATKKKPSVVDWAYGDDDDLDEEFVPKRRRKAAGLPRPAAATKRKKKAAAPAKAGTYKERAIARVRELVPPTPVAGLPPRSEGSRERGGAAEPAAKKAAKDDERARLEAAGLVGIATSVLPAAFGSVAYDVVDVVAAAAADGGGGFGFAVKNIGERAVVRGFRSRASTSGLRCNDVVVAVGNLDARAGGFAAVVAKLVAAKESGSVALRVARPRLPPALLFEPHYVEADPEPAAQNTYTIQTRPSAVTISALRGDDQRSPRASCAGLPGPDRDRNRGFRG